jgi:hypothetical protein
LHLQTVIRAVFGRNHWKCGVFIAIGIGTCSAHLTGVNTNQMIEAAKAKTNLKVTEKGGCTYISEVKRGGVGVVIWPDRTICRSDIPLTMTKLMRVKDAVALFGL